MNNYLKFCNYTCLRYLNPLGKLIPFALVAIVVAILGLLGLFIFEYESKHNVSSFKWFRCLLKTMVFFLVLGTFVLLSSGNSTLCLNQEGHRLEKRYINEAHREYPYLVEIDGHKYLSKTEKSRQLIKLHDSKITKYYFVGGKRSFVLDSKNYLRKTMKNELTNSIDFWG